MTRDKPLIFRFAEFEVREQEFCICKGSVMEPVEPRAFRLLLILLRNAQKVITKEELLDAVWDDVEVTQNSLTQSIVKLRQRLGDDARSPRFIETVSKVGYRFMVPVESAPDRSEEAVPSHLPNAATANDPRLGTTRDLSTSGGSQRLWLTRSAVWAGMAAIAILLLGLAGGWLWHTHSREKWAREIAEPEVARLLEAGEYPEAAALALKAETALPGDLTLHNLWLRATGEISIKTEPAGAEVDYRLYSGDPGIWTRLGNTPLIKVRLPRDSYFFRVTKPDYAAETFVGSPPGTLLVGDVWNFDMTLKLHSQHQVPPEMVLVGGGWSGMTYPLLGSPDVELDDFLIDRGEVTNEEYQKFVDSGGYTRQEFWKQPFAKDGLTIPWDKAIALFRDTTGRPGPATWEAGHFPTGRGSHPVSGISWYEAAAYAEFAGKSLPTAFHWMLASQADDYTPLITSGSNFGREGTQPVGEAGTLSGWGTTDMAGNVKEWCLNETKDSKRLILGGGFGEPDYMFNFTDAQSPWDRRLNYGFRCMKLLSAPNPAAQQYIESNQRDFWKEKPVPDEIFKAYKELYSYDKDALNVRAEQIDITEHAKRERVSFDAAYGHERVTAYLFLPRNTSPPWQTVVFFPGAMATLNDTLDLTSVENAYDFILKSGRAIVVPIYKGTYQRRDGFIPGRNKPAFFRDHLIAWSKDLGRTLDYLETRRDFDSSKVAYLGYSLGGAQAPVMLAIEKRFKAAILLSAGFPLRQNLPEADGINFDPHMSTPTLVLNGRYDDDFPLESSQRPLFQFMGTAPKDKRLVIYDGGHGAFPRPAAVRETLDWLDKYLGPENH
jgi:DNA-binding winged helix-turn-helix (wHTH) protein/formylglycine-generating enzyme required for sulfatase activity/dienelactone hydrolase